MPLYAVLENLRFMVHEVTGQVEASQQFFAEPSRTLVEKIVARDDYVDNLKSVIQEKSYNLICTDREMPKSDVNQLRSMNTIASNLERIADFSVNMIRQSEYLSDITFMNHFELEGYYDEILAGLERTQPALDRRDIGQAFRICQCEFRLDEHYAADFKRILDGLKAGGETGDLITALMILHYLERMGDSMLNIGEAIIYALIGENLKIHQYQALKESLNAAGYDSPISEVEFQSIWGGRSGCRIGLVGDKSENESARPVVFKHGNLKKLQKERDNIEEWGRMFPGLAPAVCGFVEGDDGEGSILQEFLPGSTFEELLLSSEDDEVVMSALERIEATIDRVWSQTRQDGPVQARFIQQIIDRMEDVHRVHPDFSRPRIEIGDLELDSSGQLLRRLEVHERGLSAPFSVFIHGDFNVNNVILDLSRDQLHFIDLHRSRQTDYVQDVSVFLVSIFRLPVFEGSVRDGMNKAAENFFQFSADFARQNGDETFQARLAFGLARSFFSSTRFELNRKFAKTMYLRSLFILEKLAAHAGRPWSEFILPRNIIRY